MGIYKKRIVEKCSDCGCNLFQERNTGYGTRNLYTVVGNRFYCNSCNIKTKR